MIYTPLTKKAMKLCFAAHKDQVDKSGIPYVFHPFHLAEQMTTEETTVVALLHDVVEDTPYTIEDIATMGFPKNVTDALVLLAHDNAVPYMEYVENIKCNPIAKAVKLADLQHNSDLTRLDHVDTKALQRVEKYRKAMEILKNSDTELHHMQELFPKIKTIAENHNIRHSEREIGTLLDYLSILLEPKNYEYYAFFDQTGIACERKSAFIPAYFPQNYGELLDYCAGPTFCLMHSNTDLEPNFVIEAAARITSLTIDECKCFLMYSSRAALKYHPQYYFEYWRDGVTLKVIKRLQFLLNTKETM